MRYIIDLNGVTTRQQFQDAVIKGLPCPAYYGKTLDSLYDVLTEWSEPAEIVFEGFREFLHRMPGFGEAVEHMCADVQAENPVLQIILEYEKER